MFYSFILLFFSVSSSISWHFFCAPNYHLFEVFRFCFQQQLLISFTSFFSFGFSALKVQFHLIRSFNAMLKRDIHRFSFAFISTLVLNVDFSLFTTLNSNAHTFFLILLFSNKKKKENEQSIFVIFPFEYTNNDNVEYNKNATN